MFDEKLLERICSKYKIKYKLFENVVFLDTNLDEWMIKYIPNRRDRPYCLMHKNKFKQVNKFHIQRYLTTLYCSLDSVVNHKNILKTIYSTKRNTYKQNRVI